MTTTEDNKDQGAAEAIAAELAYAVGFEDRRELCRLDAERILSALAEAGYTVVPSRWIDEAVSALDSATIIGIRSCNPGDGLNIANHDRLIREAQQWSTFARSARSLPVPEGDEK